MPWVDIPNSVFETGKPARALDMRNLRDNFAAMAAGDSGAPRLQFAAMDTWFSTAGAIGTYVFARRSSGSGDIAFGSTLAGSSLSPTSALYTAGDFGASGTLTAASGSALSGTWQCMGNYDHVFSSSGTVGGGGATLWMRIS